MIKQKAFTLIELLIAMTVFAIVAVVGSVGLHTLLKTRLRLEESNRQLQEIISVEFLMRHDFTQMIDRRISDVSGSKLPALIVRSTVDIEFTRGGAMDSLSHLQRVAYQFKNHQLYRLSWPVLDRVPETIVSKKILLNRVKSFSLQYVDQKNRLLEAWSNRTGSGENFPKAVIVSIQFEDNEKLKWIFIVRGRGYA